ncbi:discoidin domain-containing protein [Paenibacillus sp. J5C_2022]|uniref:discoidin domain-containing protein n=1 Tax=Paenibacillus sp. J5C2022 TaxID=2977129 RepID=UPI0021D1E0D1|nr:discoidin domain-containing protein [Paenibacillus sp. J5C2022]MCU6712289.1 discoidin domain-containing protein [Paenibacillus sp. J5C2022]
MGNKSIVLTVLICMLAMLVPRVASAADVKFVIGSSDVTASGNDGNVPANTVDGDPGTRWSASGDGQWIQYDLGANAKVSYVKIAFLSGSSRTSTFDILTSTDGSSFTAVSIGVTSALADGLQTFDFPDQDPARYVRIVGHGNSVNLWNSYTEVEIYGDVSLSSIPKVTVTGANVTASADDGNVPANTVDGDSGTRWSANGDGQWIQYDLGASHTVSYVKIAFLNGSSRTSTFDIQTSADGSSFASVSSGVTSALADGLQTFDFPDTDPVRYVRIVGHGNSANLWNSYTEVEIYGTLSASSGKLALSIPQLMASGDDGNIPAFTIDGDLSTRWSANGDGEWISYDLGVSRRVEYVKLAFSNGSQRTFTFDLQASYDGYNYDTVLAGAVSGLNDNLQLFEFADIDPVRYIRIVGHGNTTSTWNSLSEVEIYGGPSSGGNGDEGTIVAVDTATELASALGSATAGTTIVLADGTYSQTGEFVLQSKNGTADAPIVVKALNRGQAIISGGSGMRIEDSSHIVVDGLKFTNSVNAALVLEGSDHVRITRNKFALPASGGNMMWLQVRGTNSHHNRIDRNDFGPKSDTAPLIAYEGENGSGQISQYDVIEYNYFHDVGPWVSNGKETIRLGLSGISLSHGYNTIQYNVFEDCDGEPEIVSVKSSSNTVRFNTFRTSRGSLTLRHGHNNSVYGNFFLGDGVESEQQGIRMFGNDHKIYNNYFENLTDEAIYLPNGDFDGGTAGYPANPTSEQLRKQWKIYRALIVNNTIVNSDAGIVIGSGKAYAPEDVKVANNIVRNDVGTLYYEAAATNTVFEGNIGYGSTIGNVIRSSGEIANVNPLLITEDGLQKLSSASPAIDAAAGTYAFVITDMDGQVRTNSDIGADEYGSASILNRPLVASDVGLNTP